MKIGINATLVKEQNSGSGFYIINLINSLTKFDKKNEYYIFINRNFYDVFIKNKKSNFIVIDKRFKNRIIRVLWELLILPFEIRKRKIDVLHCPNYITPLIKLNFKLIVTFHDLTFFLFPEKYTFLKRIFYKIMVPYFINISNSIISDSNNTKKDLLRFFKINKDKVKVIFLSYPEYYNSKEDEESAKKTLEKYGILKDFALFVGVIEPRKNILSILKAFVNINNEINMDLVIVGRKGWYSKEIDNYLNNLNQLQLKNRIIFTGFVSEEDLVHFYRSAMMFIYPSFYEGFGLPPLQAMACGTPVITSNISSLPEIVDDAAVKINPDDISQLEESIKLLYNNPLKREELIKKGLEQCKKFDEKNFSLDTIKVYEECFYNVK